MFPSNWLVADKKAECDDLVHMKYIVGTWEFNPENNLFPLRFQLLIVVSRDMLRCIASDEIMY